MFEKKFLMPLLCLVVALSLSATATRGANILFVSSMTAVEDDALKAFMEGLGHTVTYIDDDEDEATTEAAAAAADLVFISESCGSGAIKNEITELEVPIIVGEPWAWDEMGLTEGSGGDDAAVTTDVDIVDPGHYLAAGLSGTVAVLTDILEGCNLGKGITGPEATVIATATLSDGVTYDVIFVYEKGAALPVAPADGSPQVAADIRIGYGFHANCYPVLSDNAYALLGVAVDYALGLTVPAEPAAEVIVIERRVAASEDDNEEHVLEDGKMEGKTSSDLELGYEKGTVLQTVGIRLLDIQVPQGATITSAWVQFDADDIDNDWHVPDVSVIIEGERSPNPVTFSEDAGDITSRLVTTASVVWDIPQWMVKHGQGPEEQTPDISAIIQEIVDQPDWAPGNAIVLLFRDNPDKPSAGTREAEAFDGTADAAPLLHIEYTEPAPPAGANIVWVTATRDYDVDGVQDDQAFIDWLVAEGHTVDVRIDYWGELDLEPNKVDELNAADLVIISRSCSSGDHDDGDEPALWNSVTSPLITLNGFLVRSSRWRWMDTTTMVDGDDILMALDTSHPVFDGVTLEMDNMVIFRDNTIGSGTASFVGSIDVGNGTLIAQTLSADQAWIAEWAAGVEFYAGSGETAGGPRMLFGAGTQEADAPLAPWGAWDLTADGEQMLRNAINYMLPEPPPPTNIIWVSTTRDEDLDGVQDDQGFIDWLTAEGHNVDVRLDYWNELDLEPAKADELNAADLVIISRSTSSGDYDEGDEPTLWNSVTTPLILMNGYIVRSSRWLWMDTTTMNKADDILMALDPTHPIFDGVMFEMGNMVIFRDNTIGSGITSFVGTTAVGNGTLIAQTLSPDQAWIAEWAAGVEFYAGCGQIAGGTRMLFTAGTQEDDGPPPTAQGEWDLTADGEIMLRNAIAYMLPPAAGANIIWVSDMYDDNGSGTPDDQEWVDILEAEGYTVDYTAGAELGDGYWRTLDDDKIAALNAADLVIFSRNSNSGKFDDGDEIAQWNSITTPLIQQSAHLVRSSRWKWLDTGDALDLAPVMELADGTAVVAVDDTMGLCSFAGTDAVGNGTLLASGDGLVWIAEWAAGVEYYDGAGQTAGGPRMYFVAGTKEDSAAVPMIGRGEMNLTPEGLAIFLDAVSELVGD